MPPGNICAGLGSSKHRKPKVHKITASLMNCKPLHLPTQFISSTESVLHLEKFTLSFQVLARFSFHTKISCYLLQRTKCNRKSSLLMIYDSLLTRFVRIDFNGKQCLEVSSKIPLCANLGKSQISDSLIRNYKNEI